MAAGDIVKEALLAIEEFTVKANEDIEKGEIVYNDGNGILAAPSDRTGYMTALKAHDYSAETTHKVLCAVSGFVEAQKKSGTAIKKGEAVVMSGTAGEVRDITHGTDTMADVVGTCVADAASTDATVKILLGVR